MGPKHGGSIPSAEREEAARKREEEALLALLARVQEEAPRKREEATREHLAYVARLPQFEPRPILADLQEYEREQGARSEAADAFAAKEAISKGGPWRKDSQAKDWVGKPIAETLNLDLDSKPDKEKVKGQIKAWLKSGALKEYEGKDDRRNKRTFVTVGQWVESGATVIDDVLSKFMAPHIRDATKLKPFLKDTKRAIAGYVGARETEYDRRKAKKLLSATSIDLEATKRKLQEIARWPELSNYLKRLHREVTLAEQPQPSSRKQVKQELQRRAHLHRSYSNFDQIAWRLSQLEIVVNLANERVSLGPGDAQRDQIARDFTDQLASAWHSATETLPTCSKPTPRLKNPSPFARLLETINQELLAERHRSLNDFHRYGIKSVKRLRQLIGPDC